MLDSHQLHYSYFAISESGFWFLVLCFIANSMYTCDFPVDNGKNISREEDWAIRFEAFLFLPVLTTTTLIQGFLICWHYWWSLFYCALLLPKRPLNKRCNKCYSANWKLSCYFLKRKKTTLEFLFGPSNSHVIPAQQQ